MAGILFRRLAYRGVWDVVVTLICYIKAVGPSFRWLAGYGLLNPFSLCLICYVSIAGLHRISRDTLWGAIVVSTLQQIDEHLMCGICLGLRFVSHNLQTRLNCYCSSPYTLTCRSHVQSNSIPRNRQVWIKGLAIVWMFNKSKVLGMLGRLMTEWRELNSKYIDLSKRPCPWVLFGAQVE